MTDPANLPHSEDLAKPGDDGAMDWTFLADHVGAFCDAWETGDTVPEIAEFVPTEPAALRHMTLVELCKVDLEQRWHRKQHPRYVEAYAKMFPELAQPDGRLPNDLIYEEYHIRRQCGDNVEPDEYRERFADQAASLARLFGDDAVASTSSTAQAANLNDLGDSVDDFDLIQRLGAGAFGTVYLALQRSMQRFVALKVTTTQSREAQTLAQLDHPHIVRVYDQRALPDRGLRLLYMQYVAGTSLDQINMNMRRRPHTEWSGAVLVQTLNERLKSFGAEGLSDHRLSAASWTDVVCRLGIQLASALEYAHGEGVLHRDLKPANVLLDAVGSAKIVDFNISYCSKLDGATPAAYFGGSLVYMSPEQMLACNPDHPSDPSDLDGRSDIYSLGVVLWELFSGARPFHDEAVRNSWPETLEAAVALRQAPADPQKLMQLPFSDSKAVADVLVRCLAPAPEDRIQDASVVARELRLCLEPRTRVLLRPEKSPWHRVLRRLPLSILLTLILLPNVVAGVFNYFYNDSQIIEKFPEARDVFWRTQLVVNCTAFPIGLLVCAIVAWPVTRSYRVRTANSESAARMRKRCVAMGHWGAMLCVCAWALAGLAYPIAIHLAGIALSPQDYLHFITSLALCGAIAATYPFFLITSVCIRNIYPALVDSSVTNEEINWLRRTHRRSWVYLGLGAALPLVGVSLLVLLGDAQNRAALSILSLGGLIGFIWILWRATALQQTLTILIGYNQWYQLPTSKLAERV